MQTRPQSSRVYPLALTRRSDTQRLTAAVMALMFMVLALLALLPGTAFAQEATTPETPVVAEVSSEGATVTWQLKIDYEYTLVRVSVDGPNKVSILREFGPGEVISLQLVDEAGDALPAGSYTYEMLVTPAVSDAAKAAFESAVETRDNRVVEILQEAGELPMGPFAQSGAFAISDGSAIVADASAPTQSDRDWVPGTPAPLDIIHLDDVIVDGSLCVGFDCLNGESFGFDTIRLKENNVRLHFDDTSTSASFPKNDWRIVANDTTNGGAAYLAFEDSTAGRMPFRVEAGAPANALVVESDGDVGIKTLNPVVDLHIVEGNTPTVRLEQDGSDGFTAQTWDLAGNEANFFIRDVSNGSKLPFRITPNTPTSAIRMFVDKITINDGGGDYDTRIKGDTNDNLLYADASTDRIGMGTDAPEATLHVKRDDGTAQVLVEEASGTAAARTLLHLKNNGNLSLKFERATTTSTTVWNVALTGSALIYAAEGAGVQASRLETNGNLRINGTLTTGGPSCSGGCRMRSSLFVEGTTLLDKLASVPVMRWSTASTDPANNEPSAITAEHLSPELETFHLIYGLGSDSDSVAPLDVATIALASAQALKEIVDSQDVRIAELESQLVEMEARLERLEDLAHGHTYLPELSNK